MDDGEVPYGMGAPARGEHVGADQATDDTEGDGAPASASSAEALVLPAVAESSGQCLPSCPRSVCEAGYKRMPGAGEWNVKASESLCACDSPIMPVS